jgi:single-strand selective monofunctional uracil DNA glycosylase
MAQTGVPFGEIKAARDWLRIRGKVGKPSSEHPKRPILGFDCPRSEVSGRRLWGWAAERFGNPEAFFQTFFVTNYCPLAFLEEGGKNRTPDHLPASEKEALFHLCDRHLLRLVNWLEPKLVVGIGKFAESRARAALGKDGPPIGTILHPSPASPAANQGWQERVEEQFRALGVELPSTSL